MSDYKIRNKCGICNSTDLISILNLGKQPPANSLIDDLTQQSKEAKFPLRLGFCKNCYFVQLLDIVNKEFLFKNYLYMTSGSEPIVQHFKKYAKDIHNDFLKKMIKIFIIIFYDMIMSQQFSKLVVMMVPCF